MATIRRLFGHIADPTAGGKSYDQLTTGAVPDADKFYKISSAQVDDNINRDEIDVITANREPNAPYIFTAAPVATIGGPLFFSIARELLSLALGIEGARTGTPPAAITHPITPLPWGSSADALKARHLSIIRDDQYDKIAGATLARLNLTLPIDGHATFEAEFHGKYHKLEVSAPPSISYTGHSTRPLYLRDTQIFVDGAGTSVPNLAAFEFEVNNNLVPKHYPMRNRVPGSNAEDIVWWPAQRKLGPVLTYTYRLGFHDVDSAQETKRLFAQSQKLVTEVIGKALGTTPAANELIRITQYAAVNTGDSGAEALTPTDDLTSNYEGGSFYSDADGKGVLVEVVDNLNAAIIA